MITKIKESLIDNTDKIRDILEEIGCLKIKLVKKYQLKYMRAMENDPRPKQPGDTFMVKELPDDMSLHTV